MTDRALPADQRHPHGATLPKVAIIGGGPGGLMTAYLLQKKANRPLRVTLFERDDRLGGKILTPRFHAAPVRYEAGAAEFYDYSELDDDPLKGLIAELGLDITPMGGNSVSMNGLLISTLEDLRHELSPAAFRSFLRFHRAARDELSPAEFLRAGGPEAPPPISPQRRFDSLLDRLDAASRSYVETLIHSDLATEPHQTTIEYGLHNYLMNDPAYMRLYGIDGGNEQLPQRLASRLHADVRLNHTVDAVGPLPDGRMTICSRIADHLLEETFDHVVMALPHDAVGRIKFNSAALRKEMLDHHQHHDHPAHYLRITILFESRFWKRDLVDSYCMLDRLGMCCLYDESSRTVEPRYGVLGWLLGGEAARSRSTLPDADLIASALDSLPPNLAQGKKMAIEGRVHRWLGAVNAIPGGPVPLPLDQRHQPAPQTSPNLWVVGDYLFDSTLNGLFDSADYATDCLAAKLNEVAFQTRSPAKNCHGVN